MIAPGKDVAIFLNYANTADIFLLDWLSYEKKQKKDNNLGNLGLKKRGKKVLL